MASNGQTQDNYVGSSPMQNEDALEFLSFDYNGSDSPIHFPYLQPQISPSAENLCGYQQTFPSGAVHDLNIVTNVDEHNRLSLKNPVDGNVVMRDNIPMLDYQVSSFPSVGVDTVTPGFHTLNNLNAYQGVNRVPQFMNNHGSVITNSVSTYNMSALDSEMQNRAEISRTFSNFSGGPEFERTVLPRMYSNQVRVHSSQPNSDDKLDGRFLSLGFQGQVASYMNSHGGQASHHIGNSSFSFESQILDSSINHMRGGLPVFENSVGGTMTPFDCVGNPTLSCDDHYGLQAMTSGIGINPITNAAEGQVNVHHYIPTPNTIPESGFKPNGIIDLNYPSDCSRSNSYMFSNVARYDDVSSRSKKRRMQRTLFNSSVLRSNHQIAAEPQQNSHPSTNYLLPPSGIDAGESDNQDKSGLAHGFVTAGSGVQNTESDYTHRSNRLLSAGALVRPSTDQVADINVNNDHCCASSAVKSESLKRVTNLPPRATTQNQCRNLMPQTSVQQFSPNLLQNALGRIALGHSAPVNTSSVKAFDIPRALKATSGWPTNKRSRPPAEGSSGTSNAERFPQHPTSTMASVSSILNSPTCTTCGDCPASLDSSIFPVVSVDSPLASLPVSVPPIGFAKTTASRSVSSRSPIAATSKRVKVANNHTAASRLSPAVAQRRSNLLHTTPTMNRLVSTDWKKSAMASLAKLDPALRASHEPGSMPRIKWPGFNTPPTVGFKCLICNRDLSFTPDGPVTQPPIPPAVAVLPCGHTFHDHCLLLITPEDQSKDPPCIPCAVEN